MSHTYAVSEPLTRQACEPCRRKKTKCTGERPTCSFCQRLDIQCSYLPRGSSSGTHSVGKKRVDSAARIGTKDRFRLLERQVNDLQGLLGSSLYQRESSQDALGSFIGPEMNSPERSPSSFVDTQNPFQLQDGTCEFTLARPEPPINVIEHFADVYQAKVHFQPLPLFRVENLTDQLLSGPRFLLWSFLALMLTIRSHEFYKHSEPLAKDTRSSEDTVMRLAAEGVQRPEITRSLCLIALKQIKTLQPSRAWMTIGAASRLYALRTLSRGSESSAPADDSITRGYWSVFLLEACFLPYTPELSTADTPDYPDSAPLPPRPPSSPMAEDFSHLPNSGANSSKDIGINGYCFCVVSIWGKIKLYLHHLRQGEVEKPWLQESTHTKLSIELMEFEAQFSRLHLLLNVAFPDRTPAEVSQQCEYWNPWLTQEIVWHAAHAVLNHPFIHLVVLRLRDDIPQSSTFLQQKVDLALYHASWVFRIIQIAERLLQIVDPLIADAVAAVATVQWLFQFLRDPKVAQRAQGDLDCCERILSKIASMWPHVYQKVDILRKLQGFAEKNRQETTNEGTTIRFKAEWFWDLLDPKVRQVTPSDSPAEHGSDHDSKMHLKTHFIQPLPENRDSDQEKQRFHSAAKSVDSCISTEGLEQLDLVGLSRDFLQDGFWSMDRWG